MIDKKIFLIGFMGAGKTFFGEQLATKMELQFYDFDRKIEKKTKLNIKQLFEQKGENAFRKIESDLILNWKKFGIISTGAGIIENIENQTILIEQQANKNQELQNQIDQQSVDINELKKL